MNGEKTYVLAISGGVDSVVLLHKVLSHSQNTPEMLLRNKPLFVIAHFDHGIRANSSDDAEFVRELAETYGCRFELGNGALGANASELVARQARYEFLFKIKEKYSAEAIVTAHHADDVLETMITNVLRGTGRKGLVGFSRDGILRPLLHLSKANILAYAKKQKLQWREDQTNEDLAYTRNYIRHTIVPKLKSDRQKLLGIRDSSIDRNAEIDALGSALLVSCMRKGKLVRSRFVVLPHIVQCELVSRWLQLNKVAIERKLLARATMAIKVLQPEKTFEINTHTRFRIEKAEIVLEIDPQPV